MKFGYATIAIVLFSFTQALAQDSNNPQDLVSSAQNRLAETGRLAQEGKFAPAAEAMQAAMASLDRAVSLAPDQIDIRLARGFAYGYFPSYLNKTAVAREDLETAIRQPQFQNLPKDQRARAHLVLGIVFMNLKDSEKAFGSFRTAVNADPDSRWGKDAGERMKTLASSGFRPDRFPNIPSDTSPIVAAASITYPDNPNSGPLSARFEYLSKQLDGLPGLLGKHMVASVDKPGMLILFTWWKDKQALNDFYYSDLHQAWMSGRGQQVTGGVQIPNVVPTQLGVEIFSGLSGGVRMNGGFIPGDLFQTSRRRQ